MALFTLLAASIRWNWQAVVASAIAMALIVWAIAFATAAQGNLAVHDLRLQIIRALYLIMIGIMLAFVSALRERRREQLAALANWPGPDRSQSNFPNIGNMLRHCAEALDAPRVLVLWEEQEEPFVNVAIWENGEYNQTRAGVASQRFFTTLSPSFGPTISRPILCSP